MTTESLKHTDTKSDEPTVQATVKEMQSYFVVTGAYRTEDLNRVIGDQRQGVGFVMHDGYAASTRKHL